MWKEKGIGNIKGLRIDCERNCVRIKKSWITKNKTGKRNKIKIRNGWKIKKKINLNFRKKKIITRKSLE